LQFNLRMDGLRFPLLAAVLFTAAGAITTGCQNSDAELQATKRAELRRNCLARYDDESIRGARTELAELMQKGELEPEECRNRGEQLESIDIVDSMLIDEMPEELEVER
jgi:hypothetical protein